MTIYGPQTITGSLTLNGYNSNSATYPLLQSTGQTLSIDSAPTITGVSPSSFTVGNTEYHVSY